MFALKVRVCVCVRKDTHPALTGVARLLGVPSCKWEGRRFGSGQGACLGCGFGPWLGRVWEAAPTDVSLSLSRLNVSLPLSLKLTKERKKIYPSVVTVLCSSSRSAELCAVELKPHPALCWRSGRPLRRRPPPASGALP